MALAPPPASGFNTGIAPGLGLFDTNPTPSADDATLLRGLRTRLNTSLHPSPNLPETGGIDQALLAAVQRYAGDQGYGVPTRPTSPTSPTSNAAGGSDPNQLAALLSLLLGAPVDPEEVSRCLQAVGASPARTAPRLGAPASPGSTPAGKMMNQAGVLRPSRPRGEAPQRGQPAPTTGAVARPGQRVEGADPKSPVGKISLRSQSDNDNCGKAAIAMALSAYSGKPESDTQWGAKAIPLAATLNKELGKYGASATSHRFDRKDFSRIDNSLAQGNPVVIGSGFASASGIGHFVTLAGMRGEGAAKEYLVCDPNGGKQYWAKQSAIRNAPAHTNPSSNVVITTQPTGDRLNLA